ncbi:MAG: hypothetical protein K6T78_09625 [Alicyclobacillus sp.]|nr:hypothetical protein [Alicyclobacillus sp.]
MRSGVFRWWGRRPKGTNSKMQAWSGWRLPALAGTCAGCLCAVQLCGRIQWLSAQAQRVMTVQTARPTAPPLESRAVTAVDLYLSPEQTDPLVTVRVGGQPLAAFQSGPHLRVTAPTRQTIRVCNASKHTVAITIEEAGGCRTFLEEDEVVFIPSGRAHTFRPIRAGSRRGCGTD